MGHILRFLAGIRVAWEQKQWQILKVGAIDFPCARAERRDWAETVKLTHGSLFSGIGGFDLGFERAGIETIWQVEIDDYCRRVLARHFPSAQRYDDVRTVGKHNLTPVDIISGGFPCQDISIAGLQVGLAGDRSGLWREYARIIRELRPRIVVVENVAALLHSGAGRVLADFAAMRFDAEWQTLRASDFGAPHQRDRTFLVAYSNEIDGETRLGDFAHWAPSVFPKRATERDALWLQAADSFIGMDDGVPARAYMDRVGAIGNAIVPQIAEWIGRRLAGAGRRYVKVYRVR